MRENNISPLIDLNNFYINGILLFVLPYEYNDFVSYFTNLYCNKANFFNKY